MAKINNLNTLNNLTLKLSKKEYSNNNKPNNLNIATFSISALNPIKKIILYIVKRHKEVFPKIAKKQQLHPY